VEHGIIHCAKFCANIGHSDRDIANKPILKMAAGTSFLIYTKLCANV